MRRQNSLDKAARVGGDQGAQQRHLVGGEVAAVVAALDRTAHPGAMKARLRSSLIDHGSQGDRSSGGLPPFFAQAFSHAFSQRRTSMPFIESVPTTDYMIAVNFALLGVCAAENSRGTELHQSLNSCPFLGQGNKFLALWTKIQTLTPTNHLPKRPAAHTPSVVPHKYVASIRRATGKLNPEKSGGYATHQGLKDVILFVRQHTRGALEGGCDAFHRRSRRPGPPGGGPERRARRRCISVAGGGTNARAEEPRSRHEPVAVPARGMGGARFSAGFQYARQ